MVGLQGPVVSGGGGGVYWARANGAAAAKNSAALASRRNIADAFGIVRRAGIANGLDGCGRTLV